LAIKFAFVFCVGSIFGWLLETLYRRFFKPVSEERRWVNPGFLTGPYLPMYGIGMCALYMLSLIDFSFVGGRFAQRLVMFCFMAVALTVTEYVTGVIFIKRMGIPMWDYHGMWGNFRGLICPLFSCFWTVLSVVYYYLVHPHLNYAAEALSHSLPATAILAMFCAVMLADFAHSAAAFGRKKHCVGNR
jgi:uncharacterized membrane protein